MTSAAPQTFTAAQLARALDKAPRSVRRALEDVPHSSVAVINGKQAKLWSLADAETVLAAAFTERREKTGCRDNLELLATPVRPQWQPRIPFNEVADEPRAKAVKLQRALLPSLESYDAGELAGTALEERGLADYAREFRHKVSPRTWRYLFQRSRERARTPADYARLDIFVDDNCARKREMPTTLNFDEAFGPLHQLITGFGDPTEPTPKEQESLWDGACELYQPREGERRFRRALLDFLWNFAPRLADSKEALRVNFGRKYQQVKVTGSAADLRRKEFITPPQPSPEKMAQIDLAAAHAGVNHGPRGVSAAVNELQKLGLYEQDGGKSKSYVKATERRLMRRKARIVAMGQRGSRGFRELTPTLCRDPLSCRANDVLVADDGTIPILNWWEEDNDQGFGWGNGQTLVAADFATWFVTAFSHQKDRHYNSHVARTLFTRSAMDHGLHRIYMLELGQVWQHSKILKGDDERGDAWQEAHSEAEFVYGLKRQLGIRFIHARSPEAKSQIERIIGLLQDYLFGLRGYSGRDQRVDLPERTRREIAAVKSGVHPSKFWYHIDDWRKQFKEIINQYNNTPQEGRWLKGMTPNDAFVTRQRLDDPPIKLDADSWPLLACQKRRWRVRDDGMISFRLTGQPYNYWNEQTTVQLGGETVLLHWNPETPEFIGVTDLKGRKPILVPRVMDTHSFDANDPRTKSGLAMKSRCAAALKAQYETLPVKGVRQFRPTIASRDTAELAHKMTERREQIAAGKREHNSLQRKAVRYLEELGMPLALARDATPEQVQGWQDMVDVGRAAMEETT